MVYILTDVLQVLWVSPESPHMDRGSMKYISCALSSLLLLPRISHRRMEYNLVNIYVILFLRLGLTFSQQVYCICAPHWASFHVTPSLDWSPNTSRPLWRRQGKKSIHPRGRRWCQWMRRSEGYNNGQRQSNQILGLQLRISWSFVFVPSGHDGEDGRQISDTRFMIAHVESFGGYWTQRQGQRDHDWGSECEAGAN